MKQQKPVNTSHRFIEVCLNQASPMLRAFAIKYGMDYEDLYQEAYIVARTIMNSDTSEMETLPAYIHSSIKYHVLKLAHAQPRMTSLDAPLAPESDTCLADLLPAPPCTRRDEADMDRKEQVLYSALRRLPLEDQMYLRDVFHLHGYDVVPLFPYRLNNGRKTRHAVSIHAYRHMRQDAHLITALFAQA